MSGLQLTLWPISDDLNPSQGIFKRFPFSKAAAKGLLITALECRQWPTHHWSLLEEGQSQKKRMGDNSLMQQPVVCSQTKDASTQNEQFVASSTSILVCNSLLSPHLPMLILTVELTAAGAQVRSNSTCLARWSCPQTASSPVRDLPLQRRDLWWSLIPSEASPVLPSSGLQARQMG